MLLGAGPTAEQATTWPNNPRLAIGRKVKYETRALVGDAAATLTQATGTLDLLVCGSLGRSRPLAAILGSVSAHLVAHAQCPLLVVPAAVSRSATGPLGRRPRRRLRSSRNRRMPLDRMPPLPPRRPPPGRHLHWRLVHRRHHLLRAGRVGALLAVVGPGLLAGLSDDDPPGIMTYSILGADYGYRLLWVLALSTAALVVFHEVAVRMAIVTGKGLLALVREHYGRRGIRLALPALVVANLGTMCAEFAGVAAATELLGGVSCYASVPLAAAAVALLVLRGSFRRVEHALLALSAVFVASSGRARRAPTGCRPARRCPRR